MSSLKADLLVTPQDIYAQSTTQGTDLGAKATTGDGRVFRYVMNGAAALVAGTLVSSPAQDTTNLSPTTGLLPLAVGATYSTQQTSLAIGSKYIALGLSASTFPSITAAQSALLKGGYMTTVAGTGVGYTYKISSVSAATAGATACFVTLEDPIQVAVLVSTGVTLTQNPYAGVIINPTTVSGSPVGFAVYPISASTNIGASTQIAYYGWVQTRGICSGLIGAASVTVGKSLMPSAATAGALIVSTGVFTPVANTIVATTNAEYDSVFACIE